jgi:PepSY-associated TM region
MNSVCAAAVSSARKRPVLLKVSKHISVVHRYLGIAIGFMFAVWFATGSVLSFVPFPVLEAEDRIPGSEELDLSKVRVPPAIAMAGVGAAPVERLRLLSVAGQPRYVASVAGHGVISVSAETGKPLNALSAEQAAVVAERFTAHEIVAVEGPFDYDQWTVHDRYDVGRPYYRIRVQDSLGTSVYVSVRSGEVLQRTTRSQRAWNRVGAVVHWLNPTILRKHDGVWGWMMWSLALAGIALIVMGLWLGVVRYVNLKRIRRPGLSPFTGWLRWHHMIGLFVAVIVLNWIGSGWLSVDRGAFFSSDQPTLRQLERLRGISLTEAAQAFAELDSATLGPAREIEFTALAGQPLLIVRNDAPRSRVVSVDAAGALRTSDVIPDEMLLASVRSAWSPAGVVGMHEIAADDAYRLRTVPWPQTARRVVLDDAGKTWVQIDAASGQIVSIMDTSRRVHRWIVAGPHNLDFPIFNKAEPLRHILILAATSVGFLFSCTGIVLGVKRLRRSLG